MLATGALVWCWAVGVAGAQSAPARDREVAPAVTEGATRSVGLVRSAGVVGSGWVAATDTVVTNLHVAKAGTGDIYVDFADGERVECYTAVGGREVDLAILRCDTGSRPAIAIDPAIPRAGTPVAIVGYPGGEGPTTTRGEITPDRTVVRGITTIGFTAEIHPGSSGSPVFDGLGRVRAVATFGGGLGVPIADIVPLLDSAQRLPATKTAAEWRLRIRRVVVIGPVLLASVFVGAYRRGGNAPLRTALKWALGGIAAALLFTQIQFMFTGPAHFL
jgi:S1-C subfamily serine protease